MEELPTLSVSQAVELINRSLSLTLPLIYVEGEVSGFNINKGRNVYFNIKDQKATLKCYMPLSRLSQQIEDGMKVRLEATPYLHAMYGFSLNVSNLAPSGEGSIKRALELTKAKLMAEGLFDDSKKRPVPRFAGRIGLVTSADAAAYSDVLKILSQRWPLASVVHANTSLQGVEAEAGIIQAIASVNQVGVDVLIITRGGGSIEDMMVFNLESVVRAVALSKAVTVVGVGHERDITLAELAADLRATTPTNAAQLAVADSQEVLAALQSARLTIMLAYKTGVRNYQEKLAFMVHRLRTSFANRLKLLAEIKKRLQAYNPSQVLKRGYSIIRDQSKKVVTSSEQLGAGDIITASFIDGEKEAEVK